MYPTIKKFIKKPNYFQVSLTLISFIVRVIKLPSGTLQNGLANLASAQRGEKGTSNRFVGPGDG